MPLTHMYKDLGEDFCEVCSPAPARAPRLLLWNEDLAGELGMAEFLGDLLEDGSSTPEEIWAEVFSGNLKLPGSEPVALAYAGHQFGHFSPQLGDGRAHLLGEVRHPNGRVLDLQLKGSGPTIFSRRGDGLCALGPAAREFIMSEALHALGVPCARSLAVVTTGDTVYREGPTPAAVVTRVAASHVRVGTFEYFAARKNTKALRTLCQFSANRDYPGMDSSDPELALWLLEEVIKRQVHLITEWMRVGFIHGVMNTDNTTISGETLDFGPCAMIGSYDLKKSYSSIDHQGRYAFGNQANIMQWNMARFAECLIPLIADDEAEAIELAITRIKGIGPMLDDSWMAMMNRKLGIDDPQDGDEERVGELLRIMQDKKLDYTITFHQLGQSLLKVDAREALAQDLGEEWVTTWVTRVASTPESQTSACQLMARANPVVIPRNHQVEAVLKDICRDQNIDSTQKFLEVLRSPYVDSPASRPFQEAPEDGDCNYQTFCGT